MKALALKQHRKMKWICLTTFLFLGTLWWFTIFVSLPISAQTLTYSSLKNQLTQIVGQIKTIQAQQDDLLRKNKKFTDRINSLKQKLQKGSNPFLELQLKNDLRASRELADQMQEMDKKIYGLTKRSIDVKKQLVNLLNMEIDRLSQEANATTNTRKRFQRLQDVIRIQKEKETYQSQITKESNELLLSLEVTIANDDGPDDILQKVEILRDQRDIIRDKERKLDSQIQNTQKNINMQRNMLELLQDIGRSEEGKQDTDRNLRIAQLYEEITDMEASLEVMIAKKEMWQAREKILAGKIEQFYQEASKILQPNLQRRNR